MEHSKVLFIIKLSFLIIAAVAILVLFNYFPHDSIDVDSIQSTLTSSTGIFSSLILAFLASQYLKSLDKNNERRIKINELSDKLSAFRRILYRVMLNNHFWVNYQDTRDLKSSFPHFKYFTLHGWDDKDKQARQEWFDGSNKLSRTTCELFLAMEAIAGKDTGIAYWVYDEKIKYSYSEEELQLMQDPANQISYFLELRYSKHTEGLINESALLLESREIQALARFIDFKYNDYEVDRLLIAQLAVEFGETYIPTLFHLIQLYKKQFSRLIKTLFIPLVVILFTGVIIPLTLRLIVLDPSIEIPITMFLTLIVISGIALVLTDLFWLFSGRYQIETEEPFRRGSMNE